MRESRSNTVIPQTVPSEFPQQLDIATVSVYGLAILSAALFLFLPFVNLLHPSPWQRSIGTIHGCGALAATLVVVYTGHLAFPLLRGSSKILPQMRTLTFWSTLVTFLAIATGNLAYMRYLCRYQLRWCACVAKSKFAACSICFHGIPRIQRIVYLALRCGLYLDFVELRRLNSRKAESTSINCYLCWLNGNDVFWHGWFCHGFGYSENSRFVKLPSIKKEVSTSIKKVNNHG